VAFHREIEGAGQLPEPAAERLAGRHELRPAESIWQLATGTLACPACDVPVLPARERNSPSDLLSCSYCAHIAPLRDFLSLAEPTRPTRVAVRVRPLVAR
jgi:hypothetical protein